MLSNNSTTTKSELIKILGMVTAIAKQRVVSSKPKSLRRLGGLMFEDSIYTTHGLMFEDSVDRSIKCKVMQLYRIKIRLKIVCVFSPDVKEIILKQKRG
jgi:uncharacterized membrane protein (UPF0127 family)